jgi:hypothetical protein
VESTPVVGNNFTNSYPDWREGTYDNFKQWALKQFGVEELDSDDEAEVPVHMTKAKNIQFERNKHGELVLPSITNYKTAKQKQRMVRAYIGAVYRSLLEFLNHFFLLTRITGDFTGSSIASFPYSLASKEGQTIYSPECVPDNFILSDPDHITTFHIEALYHHWLGRQKKRLPPFIILNASPQHRSFKKLSEKAKGKRKIDYVDVGDDDEDEDGDKKEDKEEEEGEEEEEEEDKEDKEEEEGEEEEEEDKEDREDKEDKEEEDDEMDGTPEEELELVRRQLKYKEEVQDGEDDSGNDEGRFQGLKFGPPTGKPKDVHSSAHPVAGPSKLPHSKTNPMKKSSKILKQGKTKETIDNSSRKTRSKKIDPVSIPKPLVSKPFEPGLQTETYLFQIDHGKKRKHVDEPELPEEEGSRNRKRIKSTSLVKVCQLVKGSLADYY